MSAMIPANSVHLVGGGNVIKQGDETPLTFQLNDESGQPVDLAGATVTVRMANSQIVVLTKQVTVNDDNTVSFAITSDEATGHGEMRLEFVVNKDGKQEIFPAQGFQQITIQPSLGGLDSGYVAVITLEEFERRVNEAVNRADTATDGAIEAMNAANTAAQNVSTATESANQAAELANGAADKANQAAQNANTLASNLSQLKTDVSAATDEANSAATSATQAATNANTAAQNATTQANYAKQQGDYAKAQAELIDRLLDNGSVQSINGQTGAVVLGANDIGAIPATEKGVAGGVAKLNEDGKVVDASGNGVEGKVKSVNGQTGEVNISIPTKTSELINDSDFVTSQFVTEKVGEVSNELASHLDDFTTFKEETENAIGTGTLPTTAQTLKEAIAEVFTNVSNGKRLVGTAIADKDSKVTVPTDPTFSDLASAIGKISTGSQIATGTLSNPGQKFEVTGIGFRPRIVFGVMLNGGENKESFIASTDGSVKNQLAFNGVTIYDEPDILNANQKGFYLKQFSLMFHPGTYVWVAIS